MSRLYVVTGSASGIGAATAKMLLAEGHRVIGIDRVEGDVHSDLSTPEGRSDAVRQTMELAKGTVDGVIASAGMAAPVPTTIAVNFFGATEVLTGLLPALRKSSAPRAVVVSSMATLQPVSRPMVEAALAGDEETAVRIAAELSEQGPAAGYAVYPSSKRALSRWVRRASVSPEWAGSGIPLNAVAPGIVITPMTKDLLANPEGIAMVDASVPMPLNYHQSAESIASLLLWLTSAANTHMAGQTIYCDGGADVVLRGDDIWSWNDPS